MKKSISLFAAALLTVLSISLSSCLKEDNTEYPDVVATNDTIHGTLRYKQPESTGGAVVAWPYGEAKIKLIAGAFDVISEATVNADGTFSLVLPGKVSGGYLSSLQDIAYSQAGTVLATPNTVRVLTAFQYRVDYTFGNESKSMNTNLYLLKSDFTISKSYFFNFYDMDGTFAGTSYTGNVFNWNFKKGWGMIESVVTNTDGNIFSSKSVASAASGAVWVNM